MRVMHKINLNSLLFWFLIILITGSFAYLKFIYPYAVDDLLFRATAEKRGPFVTTAIIMLTQNVRAGNILFTLLCSLPKFIPDLITIICMLAGLYIIMRAAKIENRWTRLVLLLFLLIFAPVWQDFMLCSAFSFNYIVPIPLMFATYYCYSHPSYVKPWIAFAICLITAAWHESIALTILSGFCVMWLSNHKSLNAKTRWLFIAVVIGFAWHFCFPAKWDRINTQINHLFFFKLIYGWIYYLYFLIWICAFLCKRTRHIAKKPFIVFALGGFVCLPLPVLTSFSRSLMPMLLFVSVATARIIIELWTALFKDSRPAHTLATIFSGLLAIFIAIHIIAVDISGTKVIKAYKDIRAEVLKAPAGTKFIFSDFILPHNLPLITFHRPVFEMTGIASTLYKIYIFYERPQPSKYLYSTSEAETFDILPSILKNYREGEGQPMHDNPAIRIWNDILITPPGAIEQSANAWVKYTKSDYPFFTQMNYMPFTGADNKEYICIAPYTLFIESFLGVPEKITFLKN